MHYVLESDRSDLHNTRLLKQPSLDAISLAEGQVLLQVERYALTSNTITYGVVGDLLGYWQFFPAEGNWGRIPAWGIAEVIAGAADGIHPGDRFYGYFPISDRLVVEPTAVSNNGFVDGQAHRQPLPPIYNRYLRITAENGFGPGQDDLQIVLRPLFLTSFAIDTFLAAHRWFDAKRIVVVSASSKTALSLAFCLQQAQRPVEVVGLTAPSNKAFVEGTGLYQTVVDYSALHTLGAEKATVIVDMAGDPQLNGQLRHYLADDLKYVCGVGLTHWDAQADTSTTVQPGPEAVMFFAPTEIDRLIADWGAAGFAARTEERWAGLCTAASAWLQFEHLPADGALQARYLEVLNGLSPAIARVIVN